jgi:hypothetical protein
MYLECALSAEEADIKLHEEVCLPEDNRRAIGSHPGKDEAYGAKLRELRMRSPYNESTRLNIAKTAGQRKGCSLLIPIRTERRADRIGQHVHRCSSVQQPYDVHRARSATKRNRESRHQARYRCAYLRIGKAHRLNYHRRSSSVLALVSSACSASNKP